MLPRARVLLSTAALVFVAALGAPTPAMADLPFVGFRLKDAVNLTALHAGDAADVRACEQAVVGAGGNLGSMMKLASTKYRLGRATVRLTVRFAKPSAYGSDGLRLDCAKLVYASFRFRLVRRAASGGKSVARKFGKQVTWPKTISGAGARVGTFRATFALPHKLSKQEVARRVYGLSESASAKPATGGRRASSRSKVAWMQKTDVSGLSTGGSGRARQVGDAPPVVPGKQYPISTVKKEGRARAAACGDDLEVSGSKRHDEDKYGDTLEMSYVPDPNGQGDDHVRLHLVMKSRRHVCGSLLFVSHDDPTYGNVVEYDTFMGSIDWTDPLPDNSYGSARELVVCTK